MKTLKIDRLRIKNFKGIKELVINPDSKDVVISGMNATGKTTIMDSFLWLLFGKDSQGKADFQIKPVNMDGNDLNNLDIEVEAIVDLDGDKIQIMKRFNEKWTKKRGSIRKEFTGHTTHYFIDEVPCKKKEFDSNVNEIIDAKVFKLVTDPFAFNNLKWEDMRKILFDICGDIPEDHEIIESVFPSDKDKYDSLVNILNSHNTIEDYNKKIKAKQTVINDELKEIPVRIDEKKTMKTVEKPDIAILGSLNKSIGQQRDELSSLNNDEMVSKKQIRYNEIESEIIKICSDSVKKITASVKPFSEEIDKSTKKINSLKFDIDVRNRAIRNDSEIIIERNKTIVELRAEWHEISGQEAKSEDTCPYCNQAMPESKIKATIEKHNKDKAIKLENITGKGKVIKTKIDELKTSIEQGEAYSVSDNEEIVFLSEKIEELRKKVEAVETKEPDVSELEKEAENLKKEIESLRFDKEPKRKIIEFGIEEIQAKIDRWNQDNSEYKAQKTNLERIEELSKKEQTLSSEYEKLEAELNLVEQFIVAKCTLVEKNVNSYFKMAEFKLFKKQINEGVKECCETIYNGVPYDHGLNNGARINVGLDQINTLSRHYGFIAPVFIDNSESVNHIIEMDAQIFSLVVNNESKLSVE